MRHLRANTQVIVTIGPFVDVGDGFTPETGVALGSADEAELIKHGSTSVVDISGATWAAVTNCDGHYSLTLTTSHTDTEGQLYIAIQDDSVCLPVKAEFQVLSEAAYDSMYVAKDDGFMDVNIKTIGRTDTQETEADNLESACSNYSVTRGLTGTAVPAAAADAAGGLLISDDGGWDADELYDAIITDAAGANIAADIIAVKAETANILTDTAEIGAAGAGLTAVPWNAAWDAEVESEVTDSLVAHNLDHLCLTATAGADMTTEVADNTILSRMLANGDTSVFDPSTDGLQPIRDHIGDGTNLTEAGGDGDHLTEAGGDGDHLTNIGTIAVCTDVTNDVGITQAGADKAWGTAARTLTANTNLNDPSAADIKTAMEADGGDLSSLMEALVNKLVIEEANGNTEIFNDAGVSQGTVNAAFTTDGTYTTRLRILV